MNVRPFELRDIEAVSHLLNDYRVFYGRASDLNACRTFLKERITLEESYIFVAIEKEKIVGFVQLYPVFSTVSLSRAYILNDLYVDPEARTSGAGTALVEAAFKYAKSRDAKYVTLETTVDNHTAQKLYEKLGMKTDDEVLHYTRTFK